MTPKSADTENKEPGCQIHSDKVGGIVNTKYLNKRGRISRAYSVVYSESCE